jgi:hypothetical protein
MDGEPMPGRCEEGPSERNEPAGLRVIDSGLGPSDGLRRASSDRLGCGVFRVMAMGEGLPGDAVGPGVNTLRGSLGRRVDMKTIGRLVSTDPGVADGDDRTVGRSVLDRGVWVIRGVWVVLDRLWVIGDGRSTIDLVGEGWRAVEMLGRGEEGDEILGVLL